MSKIIPDQCQIIHITYQHAPNKSWSQAFGKLTEVDIPVTADTAIALPLLIQACRDLLTDKRRAEFKLRFEKLKAKHDAQRKQWQAIAAADGDKSPITLPWMAKQVWEAVKNDDWALVNEALGGNGWGRRLWDWDKPYQYVSWPGLAGGLSHSIGAALAHKQYHRLCVDFQADGDFLYLPSALWTAAHYQIPMLVVMNNNRAYYNIENHQRMLSKIRERQFNEKGIAARFDDPYIDYANLARSFGLFGVGPIDKPQDLLPALKEAVKFIKEKGQLALVDVVTRPNPAQ